MARITLAALYMSALVMVTSANGTLEFGMEMSQAAFEAICWYENLKIFPHTNTDKYMRCSSVVKQQKNNILTQDFFKQYPQMKEEYFGKWIDQPAMPRLPSEYKSACSKYLSDPKATPQVNEGEALNDAGNDYPYKAFAYCLIQTLRGKRGDKAVKDVKNERTVNHKHWVQTLLDRENEFRKRHGVDPMEVVEDLNVGAQEWADKLASECKIYHSKNNDRQWKENVCGENLAAGGGADDDAASAYVAAAGWYEEIKDYPYPGGFQGGADDVLFPRIGHFTQMVWKETKYVGYGYGYNPNCSMYNYYIAARYAPAGNIIGMFDKSVLPPKD